MKAIGFGLITLISAAGVLCAQAPGGVEVNSSVAQTADGRVPIFSVEVTSRTIRAVNYHHRQGATKVDFRGHCSNAGCARPG